jgi:hypothetical protein
MRSPPGIIMPLIIISKIIILQIIILQIITISRSFCKGRGETIFVSAFVSAGLCDKIVISTARG